MAARVCVTFDQHLAMPADRAYALLRDVAGHARWMPFTTVSVHEDGSFSAYTGIWPLRLRDDMRVVGVNEEGRSVQVEKTGPVLSGTAGLSVRTFSDGGCVVRWSEDVSVRGVPRFLGGLLGAVVRAAFARALRKLPDLS